MYYREVEDGEEEKGLINDCAVIGSYSSQC